MMYSVNRSNVCATTLLGGVVGGLITQSWQGAALGAFTTVNFRPKESQKAHYLAMALFTGGTLLLAQGGQTGRHLYPLIFAAQFTPMGKPILFAGLTSLLATDSLTNSSSNTLLLLLAAKMFPLVQQIILRGSRKPYEWGANVVFFSRAVQTIATGNYSAFLASLIIKYGDEAKKIFKGHDRSPLFKKQLASLAGISFGLYCVAHKTNELGALANIMGSGIERILKGYALVHVSVSVLLGSAYYLYKRRNPPPRGIDPLLEFRAFGTPFRHIPRWARGGGGDGIFLAFPPPPAAPPIPDDLHRDCVFRSYICPISREPIKDPVLDPTNNRTIYERSAVVEALRRDPRSPISRRPLSVSQLIAMPALKAHLDARLQFHERSRPLEQAPDGSLKTAADDEVIRLRRLTSEMGLVKQQIADLERRQREGDASVANSLTGLRKRLAEAASQTS
jgi:hypothetical protein